MADKNDSCPFLRSGTCLGADRRAEEVRRLQVQEESLRLLLAISPDPICLKDERGRYLEVNPAFCELHDLRDVEIVGKTVDDLARAFPERVTDSLRQACAASDEEAWRNPQERRPRHVAVDVRGERRLFDVVKVPLCSDRGGPCRLVVLGRDVTECEIALADLRENRRRVGEILRIAQMGYWAWHPADDRFEWDEGAAALLGGLPGEIAPDSDAFAGRIHDDDRPRYDEARRTLVGTGRYRCGYRFLRPDGKWVHLSSQAEGVYEGERLVKVEGYVQDVTSSRARERELLLAASVFENAVEGICITDAENRIISVNPAFSAITGYGADEVLGRDPRILKSDRHPKAFYEAFWLRLLSEGRWQGEIWNRRKSGETYPEWISVSVLRDDEGVPLNYIAVFRDLSQHAFRESGILLPSYHDPLTNLPNKALFIDRLNQELIRARKGRHTFGVVYVDLDRFKNLNDSFGHFLGDQFLQQVAERLLEASLATDTVARFGGDEFGILVHEAHGPADLLKRAETFLSVFRQPFDLDGRSVFVSASAGVSVFPLDGDDADSLLSRADLAMYRAKELGGNQAGFFAEELGEKTSRQMLLESSLRQALVKGEFSLFYQPLLNLAEGRIVSLEALVRWDHPLAGRTGPGEFIPLAEETGLILPLGDWIFREVCRQVRLWRDVGLSSFRVAVNLSPRQFNRRGLADHLCAMLAERALSPDDVELEITEGTFFTDDGSFETVEELRRRGFRLFIDDFGTGYSSLSYLRRLPVTGLKIDQSFVRDMAGEPSMRAIVRTVVELARILGLEAVAEGVESDESLRLLREMGCPIIQGYWLSRPLPPDQIRPLLDPGRRFP